MNATIDLMKQHESKMPSRFQENAEWRRENREWLKWSRDVALSLIDYMETNGINRNREQTIHQTHKNYGAGINDSNSNKGKTTDIYF